MAKLVNIITEHNSLTDLRTRLHGNGIGAILARGAGASFIIIVVGRGILFASHIILARVMGTMQYGIYVYVITWLTMLVLLARFGMETALIRFVAAYHAQQAWGGLHGILRRGNQVSIIASIVVSGMGALVIWKFHPYLAPDLAAAFSIGWLLLPFMALTNLRQAALRGLRQVVLAQLPEIIILPALLSIFVLIAYWQLGNQISSVTTMTLHLLATAIGFLLGTYWLTHKLPLTVKQAAPVYHDRKWVVVALPMLAISVLLLIIAQTDTLMIGIFLDTTQAGIYATASRLATIVLFSLGAVNTIAAPMFSELHSQSRHQELQRLVTLSARGILAFSLPVSIGLVIGGKWLLSLFGTEFIQGYTVLVILTVGQLVSAIAGSVGFLMTMTGHQNVAMRVIGGCAILNVILNALLIPRWGIQGAAATTATTIALWNILLIYYVWKNLGLRATAFWNIQLRK